MKIITWNMQGAGGYAPKWRSGAEKFFLKYEADVVCLQECGWPLGDEDFKVTFSDQVAEIPRPPRFLGSPTGIEYLCFMWYPFTLRQSGTEEPMPIYILWIRLDDGANRVNLAMMSKEKPSHFIYVPPAVEKDNFSTRPAIGMRFSGTNVFCIHANSKTHGSDAPKLIEEIASKYTNWYSAGDYNRAPVQWTDLGIIWPPDRPTHNNGGWLDYLVAYTGKGRGTVLDKPMSSSDHYPVGYIV